MALKDLITGYAPIVKDLVTQVAPIVKEKMANTPVKNQATKSNEVRTAKVLPPAPVKQQATKNEEVRTPKVLPPAPVKKHATKIEELREPKVMTGTGWSNVTKIKLIAHGDFYSEFGYPGALLHATYELRAFGPPPYTDIGIRMRKSGETIKIGVQDLEVTHKLRIRKGDTSYGIPLLVVDDPDASPIRIFNGTDVKNWPEVP